MTAATIIKRTWTFLIGYALVAMPAFLLWMSFPKSESHILLNAWHFRPLDYVMQVLTWLGDGIFLVAFSILLIALKKRLTGALVLCGYLLSGIPVQIIKNFVDAPRPAIFLKDIDFQYFVEGVTLHNYNSFPSGHTASAFTVAYILAALTPAIRMRVFLLILAFLVGYSRIYLSQHFLEDVLAGSFIGILCGALTLLFFEKRFRTWVSQKWPV